MSLLLNSRSKGKRGELELAAFLRKHGYEAVRGQQFKGGGDSPDVVHNIPGVHIECKRVEHGSMYRWLSQAKKDALKSGRIPLVCHRRNQGEWIAILPLGDLLTMIEGW